MKRFVLAAAVIAGGSMQAQELPAPSPSASLTQRVGLTDVTVKYSRPSKKDRSIFGELVPYNEMWRTGANANTTIQFSTAVMMGEKALEAGTYSLITIPGEDQWTVILNRKTDMWGTGGYDKSQDALRMMVEASETDCEMETFTIALNDVASDRATISLMWDETKVDIPFTVEVNKTALANIERALKETPEADLWKVYRNAASYYHNNDLENAKALEYVDMSIKKHNKSWYSYFLKAQILADMGKYDAAVEAAEDAIETGEKEAEANNTEFTYTDMIRKDMEAWDEKG